MSEARGAGLGGRGMWLPLYDVAVFLLRIWFRLVWRWRVTGLEHVPRTGPVMFCGNHFVWWDSLALGSAVGRRAHFMARHEWFDTPVLGQALVRVGAFPVRRGQPDRTSLRTALGLLADGRALVIFPEGTRTRTGRLGRGEPGAGYVALKSRAPVVPVGLVARDRRLTVSIGEPLTFPDLYGGRVDQAASQQVSDAIMTAIAGLIGQGYDPQPPPPGGV